MDDIDGQSHPVGFGDEAVPDRVGDQDVGLAFFLCSGFE
jgi:hypothetical protein